MPLAILAVVLAASPAPASTLVVCAPGYPGSTAEAQGAMDALVGALTRSARLPAGSLAATYQETEKGGVDALETPAAALALVPLAFFLKYEKQLGLEAKLQAVPRGRGALERWTLVAKKGRISRPADLAGFTLSSIAGFAPAFVRGPALATWGRLPAEVRIVQSGAVLSALRKAATGEPVAVLLDGEQGAALATLPVAGELEVIATSPELPTALVATVGARLPAARWKALAPALAGLASTPEGTAALDVIRMVGFIPLEAKALAAARVAYREAAP